METLVEVHPKSFGVGTNESTWKVLPAALDRYGLGSENWESHVMFICHDADARDEQQKERCLSYDEKPLRLWIWLRDKGKHPAFVIKHMDEVKSPIALIREKHAHRRASSIGSFYSDSDNAGSDARDIAGTSHSNVPIDLDDTLRTYAVAIFPYWAEAPDELDVRLDDSFIVLSRAAGWWMVHRDSPNSVNRNSRKQGWVPSGALLETGVPVSTATAQATTARKIIAPSSLTSSAGLSKPIFPACILSMSFPAIVLKDYRRRGDGEIDVARGALVRVYKKYNYWSYVIRDNGGRGWVPSWFLGKVSSRHNE